MANAPEHPFLESPAPWPCKGECFFLYGYASSSAPYPGRASFGDLEAESPFSNPALTGDYKGGLTQVAILRYTETPVGEY